MTEEKAPTDPQWMILELMGHRRLAGLVSEQTFAGAAFVRIDVPQPVDEQNTAPWVATQFYSPSAVYCMTPCREELARKIAAGARPAPVTEWDLPRPERSALPRIVGDGEGLDHGDEAEDDIP